jgi:predicted heme/steroid binding protein
MVFWLQPVIWCAVSVGILHTVVKCNHDKIDRFFMGVFRDLGRYKAKKRRFANQKGLMMSTLLRQDDPLADLQLDMENENNDDLVAYTEDELYDFGDGLDGRPILLSIFGRVYDVSAGEKYYGPQGNYHVFAGNDVTYSLSTGCRTQSCIGRSTKDLTEHQLNEGKRWLSFFHLHDKYPLKGTLETDHVQILIEDLIQKDNDGKNPLPPIMRETEF